MREIKFRVWNAASRKMWPVDKMVWNDDGTCHPVYKESYLIYSDNDQLMQFTGQLDKNGKEIYEGDIVVDTLNPEFEHSLVTWSDDDFAFRLKDNWDCLMLNEFSNGELEVMGNVHENPGFLNQLIYTTT